MTCQKTLCISFAVVALLPALASAGPILELLPPDIAPSLLPPPILPIVSPEPVPPSVQSLPSPTPSENVSGVRYYLDKLRSQPSVSWQTDTSRSTTTTHTRDSASLGSLNMSADSISDVEPTVVAINKNDTIWTTSVYTKFIVQPGNLLVRNYFSSTSDFTTVYKGELPVPAEYQLSADPYLAANPYNNGAGPGRLYASGIVYNQSENERNAVALWRSDDGGRTWANPKLVDSSNGTFFLDKPHVAVSWHPGSLGHVYVAYVRFQTRDLLIAKSTDGGDRFEQSVPIPVGASPDINGAQVVVNPFWGHVYVLWTDFRTKAIKMSTSLDLGATWSQTAETVASINTLSGTDFLNGGPRAPSFPIARFNPVANRISVVWHEREQPTSSNTDVYYISKSASSGLWQPAKVRVNDVQLNDQFFPALDADATGNMIVTFYDRRNDPANILYQLFSARIDPNGNRLEPNRLISTFQSDPRRVDNNFLGDYQDSWSQSYSGTYYYFPASIGIPTTGVGDVYVSAINPVAEFADVPSSYWAYAHIKAIVTRGSMFGCGGGNFCPLALVDRKMLADYIIVAMHQTQSAAAYNAYFDDIANDAWAPFINRMKELNITSGCSTRQYCPNTSITRAQAAVFIIKGMGQTPSTAPYNAYFDDIPNNGTAPYINRMFELGITVGCNTRQYCPNNTLRKDEMAVFLNRAFPT